MSTMFVITFTAEAEVTHPNSEQDETEGQP